MLTFESRGAEGDETDNGDSVSSKKREANRRNAQLSTGPRTKAGKNHSRGNALRHGILASALLVTKGGGTEDATEFEELLHALNQDLAPVGRLEEMMVEKIAVYSWRQKRALRYEALMIRRASADGCPEFYEMKEIVLSGIRRDIKFEHDLKEARKILEREGLMKPAPETKTAPPLENDTVDPRLFFKLEDPVLISKINDAIYHFGLPEEAEMNRILRYETAVQRQLAYSINQLERLQRARKGEHVAAPVSVQVSGDQ